jgi:23S rRNA (cytidine1920-2'-O)/16S rRNA (cytidine1409-2'-O)-methyltransferase
VSPARATPKRRKLRIDQLLVERNLVDSRAAAQSLILAGKVLVEEVPASKPGQLVGEEQKIRVVEGLKYVSRGGLKLEAALDAFPVDATNKVVVDVGASTGGFTDCLLERGAARVYAIDVGYGQLAWKIRQDPRVTVLERLNARNLSREMFADPVDLAVMDVSFIGAGKILVPLAAITNEAIVLIKPQFEAGPDQVPRGGVIRDTAVLRKVLSAFYSTLQSWHVHALIESPLPGASGNREFLVHLKKEPGWSEEQYMQKVKELVP